MSGVQVGAAAVALVGFAARPDKGIGVVGSLDDVSVDLQVEEIEELYRSRYLFFRNGMAALTGSYDSARDVVQEAFARAASGSGSVSG
jgi:hypothetical protein